jgi:hypothetical protein
MKIFAGSVMVMALLLAGGLTVSAQRGDDKDEAFRNLVALIDGGNYQFQVQSVNPVGGRSIHPSSIYTMTNREGSFSARLPYFGRAYQGSYGGDGGIEFNGEPENLEIRVNEKKRNITVLFDIKGKDERFEVMLSAGYSGYGNLSINSQKRQTISYYGSIGPLKGN